jgi:hypothetical protein
VLAADVAACGAVADGVLSGLTTAGEIGACGDPATSAATGMADGWVTGPDVLPYGGPGCLVRDGLELGAVDGVDDGDGEGAGVVALGDGEGTGVVALGDGEGTGVVALGDGAGVGVVGAGEGDEAVGPGLGADESADDVAKAVVIVACPLDPEEVPGAVTVEAAATAAPQEQAKATADPAVRAPRTKRALRLVLRAWPSAASERAPSALPSAPADIRPPCLGLRT